MFKLILLDRDGVINKELGAYVTNPNDFELLPHVIPNLIKLKRAGVLVVVITNQGGIAKGLYAHQTLVQIHQKLKLAIAEHQLFFDEIYYCDSIMIYMIYKIYYIQNNKKFLIFLPL